MIWENICIVETCVIVILCLWIYSLLCQSAVPYSKWLRTQNKLLSLRISLRIVMGYLSDPQFSKNDILKEALVEMIKKDLLKGEEYDKPS